MEKTKTKRVHSDIVRDSINTFGTNAIGAVLSLIAAFLTMRRVAPGDKAYYLMVQTWGGGFNTILGLSVSSAVIYFVARYTIKNAKTAVRKLTLLLGGAILLIASATMLVLRNSSFFKTTPSPFLIAIVVYGIMSLLFDMCSTVLRGENKFKWYNTVNLTQQILMLLLAVFIFFHPKEMLLWTWATIGITFTMLCVTFFGVLRWNGPKPVPAPENDRPVKAGEMVNYGLRSYVSNVMTYINSFLGVYLVQARYSAASYSIYNTANTMLQQIWLLPNAVGLVILSRIASMKEQNDKVRLAVLSAKVVTYITAVTAVLLFLLARLLVPVLFPQYAGAVAPFGYLIIGGTILCYSKVLSNSIAAYGRPELNIIPTAVGIVTNIGFCFLFAAGGVNGIAIATSLSLTMQGLTSVAIFCRFSQTKPYRLFIPSKEEIAMFRGVLHR
jgi:O-antigen/teichoic acid export membrane protein